MGKKVWSIVDGYRPPLKKGDADNYQGHECILILNKTEKDAHLTIDIYCENKTPIKGIEFTAPADRISTFYTHAEFFVKLAQDLAVRGK